MSTAKVEQFIAFKVSLFFDLDWPVKVSAANKSGSFSQIRRNGRYEINASVLVFGGGILIYSDKITK